MLFINLYIRVNSIMYVACINKWQTDTLFFLTFLDLQCDTCMFYYAFFVFKPTLAMCVYICLLKLCLLFEEPLRYLY